MLDRLQGEPEVSIGIALDEMVSGYGVEHTRDTRRNREPRPEPSRNRKTWGALMARDGGRCWICDLRRGFLVADHLRPRSAFEAWQIHYADRTDNLRICCFDCNAEKSNRTMPFRPPPAIVVACLECKENDLKSYSEFERNRDWAITVETSMIFFDVAAEDDRLVYCRRHGTVTTVGGDWPLMVLRSD